MQTGDCRGEETSGRARQRDGEARSVTAAVALRDDPPAVQLHDAAHDGEAEAAARARVGGGAAAEVLEDVWQQRRVDARRPCPPP